MKYKHTTLLAAIVLMGLTIFASCKKDNETKAPEANNIQCASITHPEQIDDMNAYLKNFKHRILSPAKGDNEELSLEEAEWHLSSLANYDFANANVEFDDIRNETLSANIPVSAGKIALSDLGTAYAQIADDIDNLYNNLDLDNKHFRFINTSISDDGEITVSLMVTFDGNYHCWSPNDSVYCDMYFSSNTVYPAFGFGMSELERVLNIIESRNTNPSLGRLYYTITRREYPLFVNYIDPYGSPNFINSRIYCTKGVFNEDICENMCYYLCSYLELGRTLRQVDASHIDDIICWSIEQKIYDNDPLHSVPDGVLVQQTAYHKLEISFGLPVATPGHEFDY